jgi:predicted nucleotidyltransferase
MAYKRTLHERLDMILEKLFAIESERDCKIVFAVEAGSRAFGTSSPTSDYDVRFVYKKSLKHYLSFNNHKDTISAPEPGYDISGWDIKKTCKLASQSNCSLYEWFFCKPFIEYNPFVYDLREQFLKDDHLNGLFESYRGFAKTNYFQYCAKTSPVRIKAYIYGFRALAAMYWINEKKTYPSIVFQELITALPYDKAINKLLDLVLRRYNGESEIPNDLYLEDLMQKDMLLECKLKKIQVDPAPYDAILYKEITCK